MLGRCVCTPHVWLDLGGRQPPRLRRYPLEGPGGPAGELLAAFELLHEAEVRGERGGGKGVPGTCPHCSCAPQPHQEGALAQLSTPPWRDGTFSVPLGIRPLLRLVALEVTPGTGIGMGTGREVGWGGGLRGNGVAGDKDVGEDRAGMGSGMEMGRELGQELGWGWVGDGMGTGMDTGLGQDQDGVGKQEWDMEMEMGWGQGQGWRLRRDGAAMKEMGSGTRTGIKKRMETGQ